jgi:hypothetical protein
MIYCGQCGSEEISVQQVDTMATTYYQQEDGTWNQLVPIQEGEPAVEFWCSSCEHLWEMSGTLEDVFAGEFDEDVD